MAEAEHWRGTCQRLRDNYKQVRLSILAHTPARVLSALATPPRLVCTCPDAPIVPHGLVPRTARATALSRCQAEAALRDESIRIRRAAQRTESLRSVFHRTHAVACLSRSRAMQRWKHALLRHKLRLPTAMCLRAGIARWEHARLSNAWRRWTQGSMRGSMEHGG